MSGRDQDGKEGFTLVEVLLSVAILSFLIVLVAGMTYTAQATTRSSHEWGDRSEELQVAISQIAEDMTFGNWDQYVWDNRQTLLPDTVTCPLASPKSCSLVFVGYHPKTTTSVGWDTRLLTGDEQWPGYLNIVEAYYVKYSLENGQLVRTTWNGIKYAGADNPYFTEAKTFSRKVLAQNLTAESYFQVENAMVSVVLQAARKDAGVNEDAQVTGHWYLPPRASW